MGKIIPIRFSSTPRRLRDIRERAGRTRAEFARDLSRSLGTEIAPATLTVWEDGRVRPPPDVLDAAEAIAQEAQGPLSVVSAPAPLAVVRGLEGGRPSADAAAWASQQADLISRLDDQVGGPPLLPLAVSNLDLALTLIRGDSTQGTRTKLQRSVAELARLAGWLAVDAGQHQVARDYWRVAIDAAREAGDSAYAAHIVAYHALQATFQGNGQEAINFLEAARQAAGPDANLALRAVLDEWAISAWALVGDGRQAARHLLRGDELWDRRSPADDPEWLYWMTRPSENPEAGQAFLRLGQPRTAEQLLTAGLDALPKEFERDRGLYLIRIAHAQLAQPGRLDEAIATAGRAAELGGGVESPRARQLMSDFLRELPHDEPEVRVLRERLREVPVT